jgi:two-component system OmpR family response regulator
MTVRGLGYSLEKTPGAAASSDASANTTSGAAPTPADHPYK